jgi:hypothetical protein
MIGYTLKPGSESTLEVGGATYAMYTQGDGLWIKNAAEEERMVDAMRKAADATVKGVSAKGTETTDVFSLKGLSQALDRLAQDCRRGLGQAAYSFHLSNRLPDLRRLQKMRNRVDPGCVGEGTHLRCRDNEVFSALSSGA